MAKLVLNDVTTGFASTDLLNANNAAIKAALENTLSRDGTTPNTMSADLDMNGHRILNELAQTGDGFIWKGIWVTATSYALNNLVFNNGKSYICTTAHTSGTFGTDLGAGKWELLADQGAAGTGAGDMLKSENLSGLADNPTALANIGAAAKAGFTATGGITMSGASIFDANATIAVHATAMNPWSLGNYVTATGAAITFTGLASAPQAGAEVEIYMNEAHTFTNGVVFEVDGNANYTATIGDRVLIRAKSTTVFTVHPIKKNGRAVIAAAFTSVQVFTTAGTSVYTKPAGLVRAKVTVVGSGGGGGSSSTIYGGGGGAGGCAIKILEAASIAATETVTIGAAGAAGVLDVGGNGGTSSFGAHASATGGAGGPNISNPGGAGGMGSGGNINLGGGGGGGSSPSGGSGGSGGSSCVGGGGGGGQSSAGGTGGTNTGGGGGGGAVNANGGAGALGIVIVEEYF